MYHFYLSFSGLQKLESNVLHGLSSSYSLSHLLNPDASVESQVCYHWGSCWTAMSIFLFCQANAVSRDLDHQLNLRVKMYQVINWFAVAIA